VVLDPELSPARIKATFSAMLTCSVRILAAGRSKRLSSGIIRTLRDNSQRTCLNDGHETMRNTEQNELSTGSEYRTKIANPADPWEAAYLRFETPEQEIRKFVKRLRALGADKWPRESEIVELFCGRGNGLRALQLLGFTRVEGVDLSAHLVAQYRGNATCYVGDCRQLLFADQSKDVLIVQGGLHHLPSLPDDLERTLAQMHRVLRKDGRVVLLEPWLTPFLRLAHFACENSISRRLSNKVDALAVMIQHERQTYEQWLNHPGVILQVVRKYFAPSQQSVAWGKWSFVGRPV
jgi:ubiquinone/menaquinone biosynthesis C-methylase UbiE